MLRELSAFLYLAGIVSARHYHHGQSTYSTTVSPLEVSSVQPQNAIPLEAKILQSQLTVDTHSPSTYPIQEQEIQYQETSSDIDSSSDISYAISPALVKTISAPTNKVTVESHQQVTVHPPPATHVSSHSVPVVAEPDQYGQTVEQATAYPSSTTIVTSTLPPYPNHQVQTITHGVHSELVNPVPISTQKVTIEGHNSVTVHPTSVPRTVQHAQTVIHPPSGQYVSAPVSYPITSVVTQGAPTTVTPIPVPVIYSAEEAPNPQYETKYIRPASTVVAQQAPVLAQQAPVLAQQAPVHAQQAPVLAQQAPVHAQQAPVLAQQAPVFAQQAPVLAQQAPVLAQQSPVLAQQVPVAVSQPIAGPVNYPKSIDYIPYNHQLSSPVVYSSSVYNPSIFDSSYVSDGLVTNYFNPGFGGYTSAIAYSSAPAVSSVSFNGLGVSYGW